LAIIPIEKQTVQTALFELRFHILCLPDSSEFYSELFGDTPTPPNTFIIFFWPLTTLQSHHLGFRWTMDMISGHLVVTTDSFATQYTCLKTARPTHLLEERTITIFLFYAVLIKFNHKTTDPYLQTFGWVSWVSRVSPPPAPRTEPSKHFKNRTRNKTRTLTVQDAMHRVTCDTSNIEDSTI